MTHYVYLHYFAPAQSTVTVPDNLIGDPATEEESDTPEDDTSPDQSDPGAEQADTSERGSDGTGTASDNSNSTITSGEAHNPTATALELYKGKPDVNQRFEAVNMLPGDSETKYFCVKAYHDGDIELYFKADITDGCTINQGATDDGAKTLGDPEMTDPQSDASDIITYTVQSGDTLGKIAQDYGTTAEKLAAYNGIEDPDYMQAGWTLKIPPEDYEIPASSTTSEESDESAQQTTEPGESVEKEPAEQAGSATENLPADDPSADTDSANDPSAGTDSANDPSADTDPEETTEESGSESSEPTDGELLEPDPDKTDETMESQPTEAPAE